MQSKDFSSNILDAKQKKCSKCSGKTKPIPSSEYRARRGPLEFWNTKGFQNSLVESKYFEQMFCFASKSLN